jgi:2-keto-3-deoxy-L-rhamnonate aldolase RhmA
MNKPKFKDLLSLKRKIVGTMIQIPSPEIVEMTGRAGFDYIGIDNEHCYATYEQTLAMLRAAECSGIPSFARVHEVSEDAIKKVLDMGFTALEAPHVSNAKIASDIVRYAKFAPEGGRSGCPYVRANGYGWDDKIAYYKNSNEGLVILALIEDQEGIDNLEEIIKTPGIDILLVGRSDLSLALGVPGEKYHPKVEEAIRKLADLCLKYGKTSGTFIEKPEQLKDYADCAGISVFQAPSPETFLVGAFRSFRNELAAYL